MENTPVDKVHMPTMTEMQLNLKQKGFNIEFFVNKSGNLVGSGTGFFKPSEVKIIDFTRFEGESDPGDESVLYALETESGVKGILSHIYGRESSEENQFASNFMKQVMVLHQEHPLSTGV